MQQTCTLHNTAEIKEDKKNGKISHVHEPEDLILLRCQYPKQSTIQSHPYQNPNDVSCRIEKPIL